MTRLPRLLAALIVVLPLTGCFSEKSKFVKDCQSRDESKETCSCIYDRADGELDEKEMQLFMAAALDDQTELDRLQKEMGFLNSLGATLQVTDLAVRATLECRRENEG